MFKKHYKKILATLYVLMMPVHYGFIVNVGEPNKVNEILIAIFWIVFDVLVIAGALLYYLYQLGENFAIYLNGIVL